MPVSIHMHTNILSYHHSVEWNVHDFIATSGFVDHVQPHWPLIVSTRSGLTSTDTVNQDLFVKNKKRGRPSDLRNSTTDSLVSAVAEQLGSQGFVTNVAAECSGSLHAIYLATLCSYQHGCPCVVFVADNLTQDQFQMWRFASFGALDQTTGRPFDTSSSGFRMGQGMAMLLVSADTVKTNLHPVACISAYNFLTKPELIANPGQAQELIDSIKGIDFDRVGLWNAHATGTPVGDRFEYDLFSSLIRHDAKLVSYKGHVGHCISASGAIELCMSLDDRQQGMLRANNIKGSPIVPDTRITVEPVPFPAGTMIKANFGFGGKNVVCQVDFE